MGKFLLSLCAIFCPWLVLLAYDNPIGALVAIVLQITIVGWIPASIWAWRLIHSSSNRDNASDKQT